MLSPLLSLADGTNLDLSDELTTLLAETLVLQLCTRSCHWHVTGPNFSGLHEMFDRQAEQLDALADDVAERSRALGFGTVSSIADIVAVLPDAAQARPALVAADDMLDVLQRGNLALARRIRAVRETAEARDDIVSMSLTDGWLADAERRIWMLGATRS